MCFTSARFLAAVSHRAPWILYSAAEPRIRQVIFPHPLRTDRYSFVSAINQPFGGFNSPVVYRAARRCVNDGANFATNRRRFVRATTKIGAQITGPAANWTILRFRTIVDHPRKFDRDSTPLPRFVCQTPLDLSALISDNVPCSLKLFAMLLLTLYIPRFRITIAQGNRLWNWMEIEETCYINECFKTEYQYPHPDNMCLTNLKFYRKIQKLIISVYLYNFFYTILFLIKCKCHPRIVSSSNCMVLEPFNWASNISKKYSNFPKNSHRW